MSFFNESMKSAIALNSQCPSEYRKNFLKVAISLTQPSLNQDRSSIVETLSNEYSIDKKKLIEILGLYVTILHLFVSLTDDEFNDKLIYLGFPPEFVQDLPLINNRTKIVETLTSKRDDLPTKLLSLKWKIDLSLGNSVLVKKVPVSVILCLQLGNGKKYTINVNIQTFHKLRFTVAMIMKEYKTMKTTQLNKSGS